MPSARQGEFKSHHHQIKKKWKLKNRENLKYENDSMGSKMLISLKIHFRKSQVVRKGTISYVITLQLAILLPYPVARSIMHFFIHFSRSSLADIYINNNNSFLFKQNPFGKERN